MKKWMVTLAAVVAVVALAAPAANAQNEAPFVDSINGSGVGTYFGTLAPTDSADWYTFFGFAGFPVTIRMNAIPPFWDTYLNLYRTGAVGTQVPAAGQPRAGYTLVASDDDSGGGPIGRNSLISNFVPPTTGFYIVAAESFDITTDFGHYILTISGFAFSLGQPGDIPQCPPAPISAPCHPGDN